MDEKFGKELSEQDDDEIVTYLVVVAVFENLLKHSKERLSSKGYNLIIELLKNKLEEIKCKE